MKTEVNIRIIRDDDIDGFGAYAAGSEGLVLLNVDACITTSVEDDIPLPELMMEIIGHEVLHCLEEKLGLEFSEERVDKIIDTYKEKYNK